jgi:3-oxoacyl-[acyl-carrier-protein] synthase II
MTAPDPAGSGLVSAVRQALGSGPANGSRLPDGAPPQGSAPAGIGWIKAHATGTQQGDAAECRGLAAALGPMFEDLPMTGLKPLLGHCLGASGAVEAVAAVLALRRRVIPATLGTRKVDVRLPPCRVAKRALPLEAPGALLLSESFGGRAAALVLRAA